MMSTPHPHHAVTGAGTRGGDRAVAPPTKLLGEQVIHPPRHFFLLYLQLKVTLQTVRIYFSQEAILL